MLTLVGYLYEDKKAGGEIDAIYWHEGVRYTVSVIDDAGLVSNYKIPPFAEHTGKVLLYTDAEDGEKAWYVCDWLFNNMTGSSDGLCEIHIHNIDELGTADWNHGKFGSGSTTRID